MENVRPFSPPFDPKDDNDFLQYQQQMSSMLTVKPMEPIGSSSNVFAGLDQAQKRDNRDSRNFKDSRDSRNSRDSKDYRDSKRDSRSSYDERKRDHYNNSRVPTWYCHGCRKKIDKVDCFEIFDCRHVACNDCLPGILEHSVSHLKCPMCQKPVVRKESVWNRPRNRDRSRSRSRSPRRGRATYRENSRRNYNTRSRSRSKSPYYKTACPIPSCKVIVHSERDMKAHLADPAAHIAMSALMQPQTAFGHSSSWTPMQQVQQQPATQQHIHQQTADLQKYFSDNKLSI